MHELSPIALLGGAVVALYVLSKRMVAQDEEPKPKTSLNIQQLPRPKPALPVPVPIATPPKPVAAPVIPAPQAAPDPELGAWIAKWKKYMYSGVRGISYNNEDGSSRQQSSGNARLGRLSLIRDPLNPFSENGTAIKIVRGGDRRKYWDMYRPITRIFGRSDGREGSGSRGPLHQAHRRYSGATNAWSKHHHRPELRASRTKAKTDEEIV